MTNFTEIYLRFAKATRFMVRNPSLQGSNSVAYGNLCQELDSLWAAMAIRQRTAAASELVGCGIDNLVFHYTLYRKAKESWNE